MQFILAGAAGRIIIKPFLFFGQNYARPELIGYWEFLPESYLSDQHRQLYLILFFLSLLLFFGAFPAIRSNLLCRGSAQKDFHCTRAKRTGEAIGARAAAGCHSCFDIIQSIGLIGFLKFIFIAINVYLKSVNLFSKSYNHFILFF